MSGCASSIKQVEPQGQVLLDSGCAELDSFNGKVMKELVEYVLYVKTEYRKCLEKQRLR